MPSKLNSVAIRTSVQLSLQFSFLYAILSALVFVMAYWFTQYEVRDWVHDEMRGVAQTLTAIHDAEGAEALISRVDALAEVSFENAHIYQLLDSSGSIISGNIAIQVMGALPDRVSAEDFQLIGDVHDEVENYWIRGDQIGSYRLVLGSGDHVVAEILEALSISLVAGYLAVVILGLIAGIRVGRFTEQRITDISTTLSKVADGELETRVPASEGRYDDLARVSGSINTMLDKIQRLLESQEQISNDIAHDMRTPLQRLRQRLEGLQNSQNITPDDVAASLEQTEEIIDTFNSLLRIAQLEAADRCERFTRVDMRNIITNVADLYEPAAEDVGMSLTAMAIDHSMEVFGDPGLLTQLLSNLVENAIKHCPSGTHVDISGDVVENEVKIKISDTGLGIEIEDHERIFQRFFREEKSRNSQGNGLGLALVKAISSMHRATISVTDNNPGTVFELRIPILPAQQS